MQKPNRKLLNKIKPKKQPVQTKNCPSPDKDAIFLPTYFICRKSPDTVRPIAMADAPYHNNPSNVIQKNMLIDSIVAACTD